MVKWSIRIGRKALSTDGNKRIRGSTKKLETVDGQETVRGRPSEATGLRVVGIQRKNIGLDTADGLKGPPSTMRNETSLTQMIGETRRVGMMETGPDSGHLTTSIIRTIHLRLLGTRSRLVLKNLRDSNGQQTLSKIGTITRTTLCGRGGPRRVAQR